MKKILLLLLSAVMLISLTACGGKDKNASSYDQLVAVLDETVEKMFVLDDFEESVKNGMMLSPTGELQEKWNEMLLSAKADFAGIDANAFGYKLIDLTGDSEPEFIFARSDDTPLAVFTMHTGELKLLDVYSRTYRCVITDKGELYTMNIDDSGNHQFEISAFHEGTGGLFANVRFGTEDGICYEDINGIIYTTSVDRISELRTEYPHQHGEVYALAEFNLF